MSDALEQELRAALAARASGMPGAADALERLARCDYRLHRSASRLSRLPAGLPLWSALGGVVAALGAGIATLVVLLSSGTTPAYAGWTPVPTTPSSAALAAATAACNWQHSVNGPPVMTGKPVLTDARGSYTAAIYVTGSHVYDCLSDGTQGGGTASGSSDGLLDSYAAPGPDQLGMPDNSGGSLKGFPGSSANQALPSQWQRQLDSRYYKNDPALRAQMEARFRRALATGVERNAFGLAGSDVSAVSFVFSDGTTVDATVQNGWYFAWWPNLDYPTSVRVTTTSGVVSSPMMPTGGQGPGCQFGAPGCVWAGLQPRQAAAGPTQTSTTATTTVGSTTVGSTTAGSTTAGTSPSVTSPSPSDR